MNELERALDKLIKTNAKKKRKPSKLYLQKLREGKIKHNGKILTLRDLASYNIVK